MFLRPVNGSPKSSPQQKLGNYMKNFIASSLFTGRGHKTKAVFAFVGTMGLLGPGILLAVVTGGTQRGSSSASAVSSVCATATGYTDAASVNISRNPAPPQSSTVINLTAPVTISTAMKDVTYNVTGAFRGPAITLTPSGSLTRIVVKVNKLANTGVYGPGTVADVTVSNAITCGFAGVQHFQGACADTGSGTGFRLQGTGVTLAADAMLKSNDGGHFGFYLYGLHDSHFDGAIVAINGGQTSRDTSATGVEFWHDVQRTSFNIIISNANTGYGLAIYGASANNTIHEFYGDGAGSFDSDPGISVGGGAHDNTITKATVKNYTCGAIFGEDVSPPPHGNRIDTLFVEHTPFPGVVMDHGAYNNTLGSVGGVTLTNIGSPDVYRGSVFIANRPGQKGPPPHGNKVLGLVQSGTVHTPIYAVYLGVGTTGNTVVGSASSWSTGKLLDQGTGNTVNVTGAAVQPPTHTISP